MKNWKDIWNNQNRVSDYFLELLLKLDGFDSKTGIFTVDDWKYYSNELLSFLDIGETDSVFEVGCGSGAFLYGLMNSHRELGGIDYSAFLVSFANKLFCNANFIVEEAINLETQVKFDYVVSHSVFNYFNSSEYAKVVIKKMFEKANKKIAIYDINDKNKEIYYDLIRSKNNDSEEYKTKYADLQHLFFDKNWFIALAKEFNCKVEIFDQVFEKYSNSCLRFNVIFTKTEILENS